MKFLPILSIWEICWLNAHKYTFLNIQSEGFSLFLVLGFHLSINNLFSYLKIIDKVTLSRIKYIDVIWLQRQQSPVALIEVEHTTDIRSGLLRMQNVFEVAPHLDIKPFVILPDKKTNKLRSIITEPSIKRLIGERIIYYAPYSLIAELLDQSEYKKLEFQHFQNICDTIEMLT